MIDIRTQKSRARLQAKQQRQAAFDPAAAPELIRHFPAPKFRSAIISGFWPLGNEIDVRPLMLALYSMGHRLALPCTPRVGKPLIMRAWQPSDILKKGSFDTREPFPEQPVLQPDLLLMPLLAFTHSGARLGYGGGFYDRTIAALRETKEIFTCGVAFAGQEAASLPMDQYDQRLDAILTQDGYKEF